MLLPWYRELARQYTAQPYGAHWAGNRTLIELYESLAWTAGEDRWGVAQLLGFHSGLVVCVHMHLACLYLLCVQLGSFAVGCATVSPYRFGKNSHIRWELLMPPDASAAAAAAATTLAAATGEQE